MSRINFRTIKAVIRQETTERIVENIERGVSPYGIVNKYGHGEMK